MAIEAADCSPLFLSTYSPDSTAIEIALAKLGTDLRGAPIGAPEMLVDAIGARLCALTTSISPTPIPRRACAPRTIPLRVALGGEFNRDEQCRDQD